VYLSFFFIPALLSPAVGQNVSLYFCYPVGPVVWEDVDSGDSFLTMARPSANT
jgi:hypothetical protein